MVLLKSSTLTSLLNPLFALCSNFIKQVQQQTYKCDVVENYKISWVKKKKTHHGCMGCISGPIN